MSSFARHSLEADSSWASKVRRTLGEEELDGIPEEALLGGENRRSLRHHKKHENTEEVDLETLEKERLKEFYREQEEVNEKLEEKNEKKKRKHKKKVEEMLQDDSGIRGRTVHGMMIDAGSSGSRMHVYEYDARDLHNDRDVRLAVSGGLLSLPGSDSRWTDRLRPGLSEFASLPDDELLDGIRQYLKPLLDFAEAVLHTKTDDFNTFPIYLRATAGLRILPQKDRFRLMDAVRTLFSDKTFCPFYFENEFARTISGEEEAIFGWTGINFVMGTLLENTQGAGTVINPRMTYGALDMGGASTQISYFEPNRDVMSNLFKLQIGQAKHWNLYAHSYLQYGIDQAIKRMEAKLINNKDTSERLLKGVYNPCLPGGSSKEIRTDIHFDSNGFETYNYTNPATGDGFQQAILKNDKKGGDPDACMELASSMLHKSQNVWCNFSHRGDCSFAGVYQPELPTQSKSFGKFLAFSNYYHVWDFLHLPSVSTLQDLETKARWACSLSHKELVDFNAGRIDEDQINDYCFKSLFVFQVLHNGYGFGMNDEITATEVISGWKVDWAIGAMIYEVNTQPWHYDDQLNQKLEKIVRTQNMNAVFLSVLLAVMAAATLSLIVRRRRGRHRSQYQEIEETIIK